MAYIHTDFRPNFTLKMLTRPLVGLGNLFVRIGENSSRGKAAAKLSNMSDAELEALGTTRREAAIVIFRCYMHI